MTSTHTSFIENSTEAGNLLRGNEQAWAEAYNSEYLGCVERGVFKVVKPELGVKIHDTITRLEYKEDNGEFLKVNARLCVRGDQQIAGVSFKETDLYAPVLKAAEARLLLALAAANGNKVIKTDTKQAYLYGDMGDVHHPWPVR